MIRRALAVIGLAVAATAMTATIGGATPPGVTAAVPQLKLIDQPVSVAPDGDFPVFLQVTGSPAATQIAVDIYNPVAPGEIVGIEPPGGAEATFPVVDLPPADGTKARTTGFVIKLFPDGEPSPDPAWGWEIDQPGVYPVRVRLLDADGNRLQVLMTSLIRLPEPDQSVTTTKAALMIGVHRPPPFDPDARATTDTADQSLVDQLDPVLALLADRPALPATFSITPDTLARLAGDDTAAPDLARLRAELEADDRTVLDAPYVNIDAASLVANDVADNLTLQRDLGRQTLSELLEQPIAGTWQLPDRVDADTLTQLRNRGVTRTLLPGDALASGAGVLAPVDVPSGGGTSRALSVSAAYAIGLDSAQDPVLAAHRLLGRLAATGPGPTGSPGVVVAIDPAVASTTTLQIVTDALSFGSPFFTATGVPELLDATPATVPVTLAAPVPPELGTWPVTYRQAQSQLDSYESMVAGRPERIRPYQKTLAVSAAEDLPVQQRLDDAQSVPAGLRKPFTSVTIPTKDKVTLGASDARFPLPIDSDLDYSVKVVIELEANDRVEFPNNRIETTLEPGNNVVDIRVKTRTAGDTPVRITVRSPDDGVILAEGQYTIRSTAVSGVGIVLTVGAALFLAIWWGRHWRRSRRVPLTDDDGVTTPSPS